MRAWAPCVGSPIRDAACHWERLRIGPGRRADGSIAGPVYSVDVPVAVRLDFAAAAVWFVAGMPQLPDTRGRRSRDARLARTSARCAVFKAGGVLWRLQRASTDLATCFVGISFYRTADSDTLDTAVAHIFNERGDGVIVRGGTAKVSEEDRQPHLLATDAGKLLLNALAVYKREHRTLPARMAG